MDEPLPSEHPDADRRSARARTVDGRITGRRVVEVAAIDTHDLRRRVLRVGTPTTEVRFAEDDLDGTFHLAVEEVLDDTFHLAVEEVLDDTFHLAVEEVLDGTFHLPVEKGHDGSDAGSLVAISTWVPRRHPDHPAIDGIQLRGMATDPRVRGSGCGALVLRAGLDRARQLGAGLVWARARDSALDFYLAHGFTRFGPGYTDLATALPHHDVICDLESGHIQESHAGSV